jgi:superfamily II DNA/RNA helicase
MHFDTCTPVQEQTIPVILNGDDVISCAQTGTGKTAAYILPLLTNLQYDNHEPSKLNAIVMAPTRELVQQIDQQFEGFGFYVPFSSVAIYGGNDSGAWGTQVAGLQRGADIVIATPGRLLSQMNIYNIDFSGVKYFILDEADRMLDMGFYDDIMKIASYLSEERQTIMFSATMPENIQKLARNILHDPVEVKIAVSKPAEKIHQIAYLCHEGMKDKIAEKVLSDKSLDRVILFASSKMKVKELSLNLKRKGFNIGAMHSDLEQKERDEIMLGFKNRRIGILIATDIVSRGIDIDDIQLVINYDVPRDPEDYVHRIGRTARANREGQAVTLVTPRDWHHLLKIEKLIEKEIENPDLPEGCGEKPQMPSGEGKPKRRYYGKKGKFHSGKGKRNSNPNKQQNKSHQPNKQTQKKSQ